MFSIIPLGIPSYRFPFKASLSRKYWKKSKELRLGKYGGISFCITVFSVRNYLICCGRASIVVKKTMKLVVSVLGLCPAWTFHETGQNFCIPSSIHRRCLRQKFLMNNALTVKKGDGHRFDA
ncbi:hypothetical protein TNCV_780461 [Trichonephila clavipes]|nr:hypothetical protein TNCV_780461 [Trichonephila clavipes]